MKKSKSYILKATLRLFQVLLLTFFVISCSSSDSDDPAPSGSTTNYDYFPNTNGNSWNYDVTNTDNTTSQTTNTTDVVTVNSQSGNNFTVDVNNGGIANGLLNAVMSSGTMTKSQQDLKITGTLSIPLDNLNTLDVGYTNAVMYDNQATVGTTLFTNTDSFTQDLQGQTLNYNYTLTTTKVADLSSYSVNGTSYNNVTRTQLTLNLSVSTSIANIPIFILDAQNVLTADCYFAAEIGPISANSNIGFQLNQTTLNLLQAAGIDVSMFVTSASTTNVQELTSYNLN